MAIVRLIPTPLANFRVEVTQHFPLCNHVLGMHVRACYLAVYYYHLTFEAGCALAGLKSYVADPYGSPQFLPTAQASYPLTLEP